MAGEARATEAPYDARLHAAFNVLNRWAFVPLLRAGLGPLLGTPIGGWFVLLETRGWRSGARRHAPLLYAIEDGSVFVTAGFGARTHWYRNIAADARVRVRLPGRRPFTALAETVGDPGTRLRLLRGIARNGGLSGYLVGVDPRRASDEAFAANVVGVPVVRLRPTDGAAPVRAGPFDPGGRAWIPVQIGLLAATLAVVAGARRTARGSRPVPAT